MIDPSQEELVPFSQARRRLDKSLSYQLLRQWATIGLKSTTTGKRIVLEVIKKGPSPCTTREALNRFYAACTEGSIYSEE